MGPDERKKVLREMSIRLRCTSGEEFCAKCLVDDGGICPRVKNQLKLKVKP